MKSVLHLTVTDASTEIALAFLYRVLSDDVFGPEQSVFITLFDFEDRVAFLQSVAIELTAFSPNLLRGIEYTSDSPAAFRNADVIVCIGKARGYEFGEHEHDDPFFRDCALRAKYYARAMERHAKREAKVIVLGVTSATIVSRFAKHLPAKNISALSIFNLKMSAAYIAEKANCRPCDVKNIIIWGTNDATAFPDCRHMYFSNGRKIEDDLRVWLRNELPRLVQRTRRRSRYTRSLAYALADHCKLLWHGTPGDEWTCMGVLSENPYGLAPDICFSLPVFCKDKQYQVVQGLGDDEYVKARIESLSGVIRKEANAAVNLCLRN